MNTRIVSGIQQAARLLQNGCTGATKTMNNSTSAVQGLVGASGNIMKLSDEVAAVKDKFISTKANANIEKMLGVEHSVANAEEKLRKELIDTKFTIADKLVKRVQNIFLPTQFPSGTKISLKKKLLE